jgi:hypothetical protein
LLSKLCSVVVGAAVVVDPDDELVVVEVVGDEEFELQAARDSAATPSSEITAKRRGWILGFIIFICFVTRMAVRSFRMCWENSWSYCGKAGFQPILPLT